MNWEGNASDSALLSRAIREEWGIPEDKWKAILARQMEIASGADPDATPKDSVAAFKVLLQAQEQARKAAGLDRPAPTINIGAVVNAGDSGNRATALLERIRATGILGGPDGIAGQDSGWRAGEIAAGERTN